MAVTEFLDAVDKKKKEEEAAMAAAPVSAEVAPSAPSVFGTPAPMESVVDTAGQAPVMQTPAATPQQLDQMLADPATVNVGNAPAKSVPFPNIPLEQALIQTSRDIVEYGKSGDVATNVPVTSAPADPIAQPDVSAAAPAVQAPQGVLSPEERTRIEGRLAGTNADIVASGETIPSLGAAAPVAAPAVEIETPMPVADLSVNGTDVVTPGAITESGQVAPEAVAPQTPTAGSGGMITRDSTGESFIGGSQVAATPGEVSAYNATSSERMAAANTDAAAAERMRYNAPTINAQAERAAAVQAERDQPRAPVRATEQERIREEARSEKTFRKEAAKDIRAKVREFGRTNSMAKTREFERGLNEKLESDVIENRDYNRATTDANFASETAEYNRNTLTAAQRATDARSSAENKSSTERNIDTMMRANPDMSYTEAANIVQNVVSKTTDPLSGRTSVTNIIEGTSTPMQSTEPLASSVLNLKPKAAGEGLYARGANETGIIPSLLRGGQKVTGQAGFDITSDESIEVKKELDAFQGSLSRAFQEGDRFSSSQDKILREELDVTLGAWKDPKTFQANMRSLDRVLRKRHSDLTDNYNDLTLDSDFRADSKSKAKVIEQALNDMGVTEEAKPTEGDTPPEGINPRAAAAWANMSPEGRALFQPQAK